MSSTLEQCVLDLFDIGAIQLGDFILKSGISSPIYFDLRLIISFPDLMVTVSHLLSECISSDYELICGVPYTALPFATLMSTKQKIPMIFRRKERKSYGGNKIIEGVFKEGQSCLIVEDVIVSGSSILETVDVLRAEKIVVTDAVVFLDREQGGANYMNDYNINVKSVVKASKVLEILLKHQRMTEEKVEEILRFLEGSKVSPVKNPSSQMSNNGFPNFTQPLAQKLVKIIKEKKSNLCVAADVKTTQELLQLAEEVGPSICILKTHVDVLRDFTFETTKSLKSLAMKHNFLIFEDRKFGDIGNTVSMQYSGGIFKISEWADLVTIHGVPGPGVIKGLVSNLNENDERGFIVVAEMSSEGTLTNSAYTTGCLQLANDPSKRVVGFVSQSNKVVGVKKLLQFTPGVSMKATCDKLGQKYATPEVAVLEKGADIIIVGRGITSEENRKETAQIYQQRGFDALLKRCGNELC